MFRPPQHYLGCNSSGLTSSASVLRSKQKEVARLFSKTHTYVTYNSPSTRWSICNNSMRENKTQQAAESLFNWIQHRCTTMQHLLSIGAATRSRFVTSTSKIADERCSNQCQTGCLHRIEHKLLQRLIYVHIQYSLWFVWVICCSSMWGRNPCSYCLILLHTSCFHKNKAVKPKMAKLLI